MNPNESVPAHTILQSDPAKGGSRLIISMKSEQNVISST